MLLHGLFLCITKDDVLDLAITAGEKKYHDHH